MTRSFLIKIVFPVFLLLLLVTRSLDRGLNHDEHQFVAPGVLWSEKGLLPYVDYPCFHLPNYVFLYGLLNELTDYHLLAARAISVLASFGIVFLLWTECLKTFKELRHRYWLAVFFSLLFIACPLFLHAGGKTWNHDIPIFLLLCAFLLHVRAATGFQRLPCLCLGALCVGLAVGSRLTFAPMLAPFLLSLLFLPGQGIKQKFYTILLYCGVLLVALAPSLYFLFAHTDAFLFGNFQYPRLGLLDPENERIRKTLTPWRKIRYFFKEIVRGNHAVFLLFFMVGIPYLWGRFRQKRFADFRLSLLILLFPFILMGCFAPSRYQYQHFYALIPFAILATIYGVPSFLNRGFLFQRIIAGTALLLFGVFLFKAIPEYEAVLSISNPQKWTALKLHRESETYSKLVHDGKVLTLSPINVLEGKATIYPELATGSFAWRSAHLVDPARRERYRLVAPDDLESFLENDPPAGILLGLAEERLEKPMKSYAEHHGYKRHDLGEKRALWIRPDL